MLRPSDSRKKWLGDLAERYHQSLTPEILSYLANRGLDRTVVDGARLGVVHDPDPMHEPYRGRLSIPFITPTGVVHMRFRCLEDHDCGERHGGKYEGPAGEQTRLYNVRALHEAGGVIGITEGELDALVASSSGLPAVGVPGAQTWKPHYYRLFQDFESVLILGDGDAAGRLFTAKLSPNIPGAIAKVMPEGYDVSSYATEYGPEGLMKFIGVPTVQP